MRHVQRKFIDNNELYKVACGCKACVRIVKAVTEHTKHTKWYESNNQTLMIVGLMVRMFPGNFIFLDQYRI